MSVIIPLFDAFWNLMWFPLISLDPGYAILACPLLLLVVTGLFGFMLNILSVFRRF